MINLNVTHHTVIAVHTITASLFELVVERNNLAFVSGDCVAIYTDSEKSRPYSIASGSNEAVLRFLIREMDGGEVSPWLKRRQRGDILCISPPFGWFRPGQDIGDSPFIFLATGTGIAPFLSYSASFSNRPLMCLYGTRKEADAFGYSSLKNFCDTRMAVSREKTNHHHGRITDLIDTLPVTDRIHYYCCGLENMVNNVTQQLRQRGVGLMQIHREVFFHG